MNPLTLLQLHFMHHGGSRASIGNGRYMLTVWRIIASEVEGKISR